MTLSRATVLSPDRVYRYTLWRQWADDLFRNRTKDRYVMFIGLNPSTADETLDDPTIRKCMGFTKRWGYLAMCMTNLFAFRATQPKDMKRHNEPTGDDNDRWLKEIASEADLIVAAWGVNGTHLKRFADVQAMIPNMKCLRRTQAGHPEHPLYVPYETPLIDFP